jgi:hypothetical protein
MKVKLLAASAVVTTAVLQAGPAVAEVVHKIHPHPRFW